MSIKKEKIFHGIPVSSGFARGPVFVYQPYLPVISERVLKPDDIDSEVERFRRAVRNVEAELRELHQQVGREMGKDFAEFIDVQLALLTDEEVLNETERYIREQLRNAEFAYSQTLKGLTVSGRAAQVPFFRERFADMADVSARVLSVLLGDNLPSIFGVKPGSVLVAHQLPPSDAALLDPAKVAGIVLEAGGKTSHTAIMAKAKEIPAVFGADAILKMIQEGDEILVDGYRGLAILNPSANRLKTYEAEIKREQRRRASLKALVEEAPVTLDGKMIDLSANVEFLIEARQAKDNGARGIGLFRTEYLFLARRRPPTEEEQFEIYRDVAELFRPFPVIIRTFDLGGDKVIPGYTEANPFLGWRAIRFCLDDIALFKNQLRAILRASAAGNVKIMFPMVATIEELRRAKLVLEEAKKELRKEGKPFDENVEVGVMVETPSAAILAQQFARESRFLSIGSNDLTQYTLAVDRGNERVARLFDHFHPAVLRLIKNTIDAAHEQGIWVGMCGEFGADPMGVVLLLGMGVDEISVVPGLLPETKQVIRSIDTGVAAEVAHQALKLSTALEVERLLEREVHHRFTKLARSLHAVKGAGGE
ncbi:MAG: phosphoenolpyruvate--protein phosphotransferase [candidate division WOR-3 bacterium]|uniref:Phosphoenolpyruvate-protein phosphotransferase n=1 Tax=candidate division WOR-3 bacterium TaxID=2052148 RepID=A0A7C1ND26_UNCW3|nr:phosphoenolpyruvate--protein phosphotransferase [candidate division WOR-3 bacterium]